MVPPKSREWINPSASGSSSIVTFSSFIIAVLGPSFILVHGTPQAANSRMAFGAVFTNILATSWSQPQSLPLTVSTKCRSSLSPWLIFEFPRLACMPPCAAAECDLLTGTILITVTLRPLELAATADRSPARPPPIINESQ